MVLRIHQEHSERRSAGSLECKVAIDSYRCCCSPRRGHRRSSSGCPWGGRRSSSSPASSPSDGGHGRRAAEAEDARAGAGAATRPKRRAADPKALDLGSIEHGSAFSASGWTRESTGIIRVSFCPSQLPWQQPADSGVLYWLRRAPFRIAHSDSEWHSYLLAPAHFDPATELPQETRRSGLHTRRASGAVPVCGVALCHAGAGTHAPKHALGPGPRPPFPFPAAKKFSKSSVGGAAVRWLDLTQTRGPSRVLGIFKIKERHPISEKKNLTCMEC